MSQPGKYTVRIQEERTVVSGLGAKQPGCASSKQQKVPAAQAPWEAGQDAACSTMDHVVAILLAPSSTREYFSWQRG